MIDKTRAKRFMEAMEEAKGLFCQLALTLERLDRMDNPELAEKLQRAERGLYKAGLHVEDARDIVCDAVQKQIGWKK